MVVPGGHRRACRSLARPRRLSGFGCEVKTIMGNDPPRPVHARAPSAARATRTTAARRDPDRTLGDRSRQRHAAEHHPQPALDLPYSHGARTGTLRCRAPPSAVAPTPCTATLAMCTVPMVGTFHASGDLGWMRIANPVWGWLAERLDRRIARLEMARQSAQRWLPGKFAEIVRRARSSRRTRIRRAGAQARLHGPADPQGLAHPAAGVARDQAPYRSLAACDRCRPAARATAHGPPARAGRGHRRAGLPAAGAVHAGSCSRRRRWWRRRSAAASAWC